MSWSELKSPDVQEKENNAKELDSFMFCSIIKESGKTFLRFNDGYMIEVDKYKLATIINQCSLAQMLDL